MVKACVQSELEDQPFWRTAQQKKDYPGIHKMLKQILELVKKMGGNSKEGSGEIK